ncbi:MAG: hypothetical protein IT337_15030, partial [Thermomicrobiales bacterium]|nr:hypothetical protein [Thermomicrobiales bacterium]
GVAVAAGEPLGPVRPDGFGLRLVQWLPGENGQLRASVPFTGASSLSGYDFPALPDAESNQYWNAPLIAHAPAAETVAPSRAADAVALLPEASVVPQRSDPDGSALPAADAPEDAASVGDRPASRAAADAASIVAPETPESDAEGDAGAIEAAQETVDDVSESDSAPAEPDSDPDKASVSGDSGQSSGVIPPRLAAMFPKQAKHWPTPEPKRERKPKRDRRPEASPAAPAPDPDATPSPSAPADAEEVSPVSSPTPAAEPLAEPLAEAAPPPVAPPPTPSESLAPTPAAPAPADAPISPTVPPTPPVSTPEPTRAPAVFTFYPVADASVHAVDPDAPEPANNLGLLDLGGPSGAVAYVTFAIEGLADGRVASATLTVTGVAGSGPAGAIGAIPGYWVDEAALTSATAPANAVAVADLGVIEPEIETTVDVTGAVTGDGVITFVLRGVPDATHMIDSRDSAAPPRLEVTTG